MNYRRSTVKQIIKKLRDNFLYVFLGINRSGKSTTARKQVIEWRLANPNKLVFGYDPQRRFRKSPEGTNPNSYGYSAVDLIDVHITPAMENWAVAMCKQRDCLLLIDDFRKLHEPARPIEGLKLLMYDYCDYNIDIIVIFHTPIDVLTCISSHATHYFIFLLNEAAGQFKAKIANFDLCLVASEEVNTYVRDHGKGDWPNFPYSRIDCGSQDIWLVHMAA